MSPTKSETPGPEPGGRAQTAWLGLLEAVLVGLVAIGLYLPALKAPFVFDDLLIIVDNDHVHANDAATIFGTGYWDGHDLELGQRQALYRPLTVLTYAWNWAARGNDPASFRLVNILLHALTSLVLLALLRRLLRSRAGALAGALVFAAHPLHSEAITYVSGRADLLAALGFLGAWLAWASLEQRAGRARWAPYGLSLALFGAGLLAKEMAATLPAVLVLFDLVACRRGGASLGAAAGAVLRRWKSYAGHFAVLALFILLRGAVLGAMVPRSGDIPLQANPLRDLTALERLDDAAGLLGRELALLVWPQPLSIDYSFDAIPVSAELLGAGTWPWAGLALAALTFALAALGCRRALHLAAALLFFFGTLFPVSNLAFVIGTNLGERVLYLVSFALALAVGAGVRWAVARGSGAGRLALVLTALCVLGAGWRTLLRNRDYESGLRLFEVAARAYPRASRAQYNFGVYAVERSAELELAGEGEAARAELARALEAYRQALSIDPGYLEARYELGRLAQQRGDFESAAREFETVLGDESFAGRLPQTVTAFADCCLALGEAERGRRVLERCAQAAPQVRWDCTLALGLLEAQLGDDAAAAQSFEAVLAAPQAEGLQLLKLRARVELARALARQGAPQRAEALLEAAIATGPESLGPHLYLIEFLREGQRLDAAQGAIERAQSLFGAHYLLAAERAALARARGDHVGALREYLLALEAQPGHGASQSGLASLGAELLERATGADLEASEVLAALGTAEAALRAALERGLRAPGLQVDYLRVLMRLGRWREAAQGLEALAARRGPRAAELSALAGDCRLGLDERAAARAAFTRALELEAEQPAAQLGLALLDLPADPAEADGWLADFEARFPQAPDRLALRARSLARRPAGRAEALALAERAVALTRPGDTAYVRARKVQAEVLELSGRVEEAASLRQALRPWAPQDPDL
jgi:tetratricopeptide (TPR) repeat protein